MFAAKRTAVLTLKDDDGVDVPVTLQKLTAKQLGEAFRTRQLRVIEDAKGMGSDLLKTFTAAAQKDSEPQELTPEQQDEARYASYDRETCLRYGLQLWDGKPPAKGLVDQLDEETWDVLHRGIVDLSAPSKSQAEAAQAKG